MNKKNRTDIATINTGGQIVTNTRKGEVQVRVNEPQKAVAVIPPQPESSGFAKASPNFKPLAPKIVANESEAKKIIEKNVIPIKDEEDENLDDNPPVSKS